MRKPILFLLTAIIANTIQSQTFNGSGGAITNNGVPTYFTLNVGSLSSPLGNTFGLTEVCFDISHPDVNEITVSLLSPSGVQVELVNNTTVKGGNFSSTCVNASAGSPLSLSAAPYSGSFRPTGYIGRFNGNVAGNGAWKLIVKDYWQNGNSGNLLNWSIKFGNNPPQFVNLSSSNLPLVFINTNGQSLSTNTIIADLGIIDNGGNRSGINDARNNYNGKTLLNIRGSSSQIFEKKNYKLDLCNANGSLPVHASLLGMPAESDWVLTSGYSDKTLMRNALSQYLFRNMPHYSPRTRFVELFINNEYFGVYTLMEKPKQGFQRVNIDNISNLDNTFPYITGGYIIQVNRTDDAGWYSLFPGISQSSNPPKFYYQYVTPKAEEITDPQKNYIKAFMDTVETVLNGPNFADPSKGYRRYLDLESFIDVMIINEFSKNIDGYKLSTYLYKDNVIAGGKLHAGPVWDYDIAWKNANYGNAEFEQWWQYDHPDNDTPLPTWWLRMMQDPYFKDKLYCRWHTLRLGVLNTNNVNSFIDQNAALLSESQARNFTQFPILDQYIFPNPSGQISSSYQTTVNDLKNWVNVRGSWLDNNIPGFCNTVGITENTNSMNKMLVYPNPFAGDLQLAYNLDETTQRKIEVYNIFGQLVIDMPMAELQAGSITETIQLSDLNTGTYLLCLNLNGRKYFKKVMKDEN